MTVLFSIFFAVLLTACQYPPFSRQPKEAENPSAISENIQTGADRIDEYLHLLRGKEVGLLVNHTSLIGGKHLIDILLERDINVSKIFVPEHGFRGKASAGEYIVDSKDPLTGIPLISLYGENKKPQLSDLQGLGAVVFDIQDVGVRFYTYISTMHYMMESCAESNVSLIILDRPNPNSQYIDGPVLEHRFQSFVGMHPIPVVYGMTVGELARMINGEGWLENERKCSLTVIPCLNYDHSMHYSLPVPPSPNLPNDRSIELYPSLCFFEPTVVSIGRGTSSPFQMIGLPTEIENYDTTFIPESTEGARYPKHEGKKCYGFSLKKETKYFDENKGRINLSYLIKMKQLYLQPDFINNPDFFDKLAGSNQLRLQLLNGLSEDEIRKSWQNNLEDFRKKRTKYLIYD